MKAGPCNIACLLWVFLVFTCAPPQQEEPTLFLERLNTGLVSENRLDPTEAFNIVEYLYFYNGGGVAATDISGDGLADLYFTNNQGSNKYFINEGNWSFRDATVDSGVAGKGDWSTGVSVTDVNMDGLADIYVCNVSGYKGLEGRNELFVQLPDGSFEDRAARLGLAFDGFNTQGYWFDYDLDGDDDLYLVRHSIHDDATYRDGRQREVTDSLSGDLLLRHDGDRFTDVTHEMGIYSSKIGYGLSAAIADFDGNGYPDIYVCNDFSENDYLYLNKEGAAFEEVVRERTGHTSNFSMGSDVGDLDRDGLPDIVSLDMRPADEAVFKSTVNSESYNLYRLKRRAGYHDQLPRNNVQWNRGDGYFSEVGEMSGVAASDWSWSVLVEDLDLDGADDIFIANGIERRPNDLDYLKFISSSRSWEKSNLGIAGEMPPGRVANQVFVRDTFLRYRQVEWGLGFVGSTTGAAIADFDGDGDPDIVTNNVNAPARIFENTTELGDRPGEDVMPLADRNPYLTTAQRGFLSQSSWRAGYSPGIQDGPQFKTVDPARGADKFEISETESPDTPTQAGTRVFDREPLLPFAGAIPLQDGGGRLSAEHDNVRIEAAVWEPIRVYYTLDNEYRELTIEGTEGLWQSLSVWVHDGEVEFVAGNWGVNSAFGSPDKQAPLRLYFQDIDGNGKPDPIFTYVRDGTEYTFADKDELAAQLPSWRRNNLSYRDFGDRSFADNFPKITIEPLTVNTLEHLRIYRDDDGSWVAEPLPHAAQITPLNTTAAAPQGLLLGGNHTDVLPRVGRQDAAALQLLKSDGSVQFVNLGGFRNHLQVKRIRPLEDGYFAIDFASAPSIRLRLP